LAGFEAVEEGAVELDAGGLAVVGGVVALGSQGGGELDRTPLIGPSAMRAGVGWFVAIGPRTRWA
jgi:hypothetical protein